MRVLSNFLSGLNNEHLFSAAIFLSLLIDFFFQGELQSHSQTDVPVLIHFMPTSHEDTGRKSMLCFMVPGPTQISDQTHQRFKRTLIYYGTDTRYAHFRGNPLRQATKRHLNNS